MITHEFYGSGKLALFDQSDAPDELNKTTKRMELTAIGDSLILLLTAYTGDYPDGVPATTKKVVKMPVEDLFSLIEAYVQVAY